MRFFVFLDIFWVTESPKAGGAHWCMDSKELITTSWLHQRLWHGQRIRSHSPKPNCNKEMDSISFHKIFPLAKIPGLPFGKLLQLGDLLGSSIYWQPALSSQCGWGFNFWCVNANWFWLVLSRGQIWLVHVAVEPAVCLFGHSLLVGVSWSPWTSSRSILDSSVHCSSVIFAFFRSPVAANLAQKRANPCSKTTQALWAWASPWGGDGREQNPCDRCWADADPLLRGVWIVEW